MKTQKIEGEEGARILKKSLVGRHAILADYDCVRTVCKRVKSNCEGKRANRIHFEFENDVKSQNGKKVSHGSGRLNGIKCYFRLKDSANRCTPLSHFLPTEATFSRKGEMWVNHLEVQQKERFKSNERKTLGNWLLIDNLHSNLSCRRAKLNPNGWKKVFRTILNGLDWFSAFDWPKRNMQKSALTASH